MKDRTIISFAKLWLSKLSFGFLVVGILALAIILLFGPMAATIYFTTGMGLAKTTKLFIMFLWFLWVVLLIITTCSTCEDFYK